ncbi:hypothetical protein [Nevskia ramosa]|uniref:hypothetical protein n=1 Tax=Nevskia ramosa TaxID=64002 RepID=UPI0012EC6C00|nr:hypothetical protein [Nevskia ramosa]
MVAQPTTDAVDTRAKHGDGDQMSVSLSQVLHSESVGLVVTITFPPNPKWPAAEPETSSLSAGQAPLFTPPTIVHGGSGKFGGVSALAPADMQRATNAAAGRPKAPIRTFDRHIATSPLPVRNSSLLVLRVNCGRKGSSGTEVSNHAGDQPNDRPVDQRYHRQPPAKID